MDKIPNGQNPEWKKTELDKIPNGQNPELDKIPNGRNPEWTKSTIEPTSKMEKVRINNELIAGL